MEKAILAGPCIGEFYWEAARFASHIIWKRKIEYPDRNIKFIILTRKDRYDLYGLHADRVFEIDIKDENKYCQNGYRLDGFHFTEYESLANHFKTLCRKHYDIIEHIYPDIRKSQFCNKEQYKKDQMIINLSKKYDIKTLMKIFGNFFLGGSILNELIKKT